MSYGILVENADNRVIIDETYTHVWSRLASNDDPYTEYPGSSSALPEDLIVVSAVGSGYVAKGSKGTYLDSAAYPQNPSYSANYTPPTYYRTFYLSKMTDTINPANSGYGIEIYNQNNQVVYTSSPFNFFRVFATGTFIPPSGVTELSFPSDIGEFEDLRKIFVYMGNTVHLYSTSPFFGIDVFTGYRYEYTTGNRGRVHVHIGAFGGAASGGEFDYLIMEQVL